MKTNTPTLPYYVSWLIIGLALGTLFLIWQGDIKVQFLSPPPQTAHPFPNEGFSSAIIKAAPAVVSITTYSYVKEEMAAAASEQKLSQRLLAKKPPHAAKRKVQETSGSGVIISSEGYIVTNYHVIKNKDEIRVRLNDGRSVLGYLIGSDPETDIAVLKINFKHLPTIKIGNSKNLKVGDIVLAIGDPFAIGQSVTQGILSATGRNQVSQNTYENFLQTDAAINPGNSGGALINTEGEIIGINSNIYSNTGSFQGISFAIPIELAQRVATQIIDHGYVVRGWLGVEGQDLSKQGAIDLSQPYGVIITDVDVDGPGDKAGLKRGDIITKINGRAIFGAIDILNLIAAGKPNDVFRIEGIRQRQSFMTDAVLSQRPLMSH